MSQVFQSAQEQRLGDFAAAARAVAQESRGDAFYRSMVDRFLGWKLPQDFGPDCGISFTPVHPNGTTRFEPVGTNLFTADQALAMFRHCVPAPAAAPEKTHLTPADIEEVIAEESYFTGAEGVLGMLAADGVPATPYEQEKAVASLGSLTFCVLVLRNGAKVTGHNYGAIDPARHDPDMGRREARKMALEKVWELEGYALRDRLSRR